MTKEVLLTMTGDHMDQFQENDTVEIITPAEYYEKNGKKYILFEEISEDTKEITKSRIKISQDKVEVTKSGEVNVHMEFIQNQKNDSIYQTPFGMMMIGIQTEQVKLLEIENLIELQIDYGMEVNHCHMADCSMKIKVIAKHSEEAYLSLGQ